MPDLIVNSDNALQDAFGIMRELYVRHRYLKVSIKTGKARSLDQNAILHAWIEQIARELREDDALGWKCYIKLHCGVPILRAEDAEYRESYAMIKPLTYEQKLAIMKFWPVTSIMTKPQLSALLEATQAEFFKRGVKLDFPPEEKQV
jgi:hypothetical protein